MVESFDLGTQFRGLAWEEGSAVSLCSMWKGALHRLEPTSRNSSRVVRNNRVSKGFRKFWRMEENRVLKN